MTIESATAAQVATDRISLTWIDPAYPGGFPASQYNVSYRIEPALLFTTMALNIQALLFDVQPSIAPILAVIGDQLTFRVTDSATITELATTGIVTLRDLDSPFTFGPVDPLVSVTRYTSLDEVKARLGITHTDFDAAMTTAIIAAEIAIDQWNDRSFPDTGINPEVPGVPLAITEWALDAAIAIWKAADAPFGQGGSEAWLGAIDVSNITERVLRRHPLSLGFKRAWGVG